MRCSQCGTRSQKRRYVTTSRKGGGNYKRGGRSYSTTICDQCVQEAMEHFARADQERRHATQWSRISRSGIERAAERLTD